MHQPTLDEFRASVAEAKTYTNWEDAANAMWRYFEMRNSAAMLDLLLERTRQLLKAEFPLLSDAQRTFMLMTDPSMVVVSADGTSVTLKRGE